jgi:flagellar basal-body rod modification protein FlgD
MSTIASSLSGLTGGTTTGSTATAATDPLTSKDTFLKLLVAQIKNQDPTNPTDATQFVGQLTQYSQLEQLIEMNQNLNKAEAPPVATPPAA